MREYWKKNWKMMVVTSVVILLPIVAGLLLWDKLPSEIPFHWNIQGEVDNWVSRPVAVFVMPFVLLGCQWLCFFAGGWDPKQRNINEKVLGLVLWIIPVLNVLLNVVVYLSALDRRVDISVVIPLFFGILFIAIGNYLPKCKQSYTMGIKLPWTLNDEQNWNATHRLAGKLWVVGGLLTMLTCLLPPVAAFSAMMGVLLVMVVIPTVYSYRYYKKHKEE